MTVVLFEPREVGWGHTDSTRVPPNDRSWKEQPLPPDRNPSPFVTVYGLTNSAGDVCYIGRTGKSLNHRLSRHRTQAREKGGTCPKSVSEWIRSEGYEVGIVPLEVVERDRASRAEWEWIQKFKNEGVELVNRQGYDWSPSEEQRKIITETNNKRWADPENRQRMSEWAKQQPRVTGRQKSEETRAKLSAALLGKPKSEWHKQRLREGWAARRARLQGGDAT